jgi:adenylate cyclase
MNSLRDNPRYLTLIERLELGLAKAEGQSGSGTEGRPSGV